MHDFVVAPELGGCPRDRRSFAPSASAVVALALVVELSACSSSAFRGLTKANRDKQATSDESGRRSGDDRGGDGDRGRGRDGGGGGGGGEVFAHQVRHWAESAGAGESYRDG